MLNKRDLNKYNIGRLTNQKVVLVLFVQYFILSHRELSVIYSVLKIYSSCLIAAACKIFCQFYFFVFIEGILYYFWNKWVGQAK